MCHWWLNWCHDVDANNITWPERLCCISFWWCGHQEYSGAIDDAVCIMWCQWHHMIKKSCYTSEISYLELRDSVVPLMMSLASLNTFTNCITLSKRSCCTSFWSSWPRECSGAFNDTAGTMLTPMASHDQKRHGALHFDHLYLRNTYILWPTYIKKFEHKEISR